MFGLELLITDFLYKNDLDDFTLLEHIYHKKDKVKLKHDENQEMLYCFD